MYYLYIKIEPNLSTTQNWCTAIGVNYSLTTIGDFCQNLAFSLFYNNLSLDGAMNLIFVPFFITFSLLSAYKI